MDTRPISRRRPLQMAVDFPELQPEGLPLLEISLRELHQFIQSGALVVAADHLVQRPPHQFHRVALGRPRGQGMQADAPYRVLHVPLDPLADVAAVVVCRKMQLLVTAVGSAQLIEQPDEQLVVSALPGHPMEASRSEVERPGNPRFAVGTRSAEGTLSPLAHPAEAHSGVGLQLGLVLEEGARRRLLYHRQHVFEPLPLFFLVFLGAPLGRDGARPPPAEAEAVEHAANRLPARRGGSLPEQLQGEELATPARAQPAMVGGRALFEQTLDTLVRLLPEQRFRASPSLLVEGRTPPLPEEAASDRIHGSTRAEEDAGDLGGRETVGGEQRDVHPQPSTGFHFALHFDDEILAFFGSDGDILHRRPSLWWLDGFGGFTMPQRTVACSIILCIYLAPPL